MPTFQCQYQRKKINIREKIELIPEERGEKKSEAKSFIADEKMKSAQKGEDSLIQLVSMNLAIRLSCEKAAYL